MVPDFSGFVPLFGTKKPDGQPVSSREEAVNIAMPFVRERPFSVVENSNTTAIEANSVFEIGKAGITLLLADASFNGCIARVINSTDGNATIVFSEDERVLQSGKTLQLEFNEVWKVSSSGGVGGNVYSEYDELPTIGEDGQNYFVIGDGIAYKWNNERSRYESHFSSFYSLPNAGIAGRVYIADDTGLVYTWHTDLYAEHYSDFAIFPETGLTDRYYIADDTGYRFQWGESYGQYMIRFPNLANFPPVGTSGIMYIADDTGIRYYWDIDQYVPREGGSGTLGSGDNTTILEQNLLNVLGVITIAEARDELHARLNNGEGSGLTYLGGLNIGMFLDLPSLDDGTQTIQKNDTYQNLRIRIAGFNCYKNADNPENHIVWEFKHIPVTKQMRTDNTNDGAYPKTGGTTVYKPYLEGGFLSGLIAAFLGEYSYPVKRKVTTGSNGAWTKSTFLAAIFPPAEKEVFGTNTYGDATTEGELVQLPIYARGATKVKNYNGSATIWWEGSPYAGNAANFCTVGSYGGASDSSASNTCGVSPCFPMS
jgi:hypothetical protein